MHGHGAQAPKTQIHMANGHKAPQYITRKGFNGEMLLCEMVQPGVYRTVANLPVEIMCENIGWDVAKLVMSFADFVYLRGGYSIDTAKFDKPA